jgi:hypothetical protein
MKIIKTEYVFNIIESLVKTLLYITLIYCTIHCTVVLTHEDPEKTMLDKELTRRQIISFEMEEKMINNGYYENVE